MADNEAALVRRLRSQRRTEQLQAATSLCQLASRSSAACAQLAAAGCVPPLAAMLSSGSQALQEAAAAALRALVAKSQPAKEAGAAAIPALVSSLAGGSAPALQSAATALGSLADSPARCAAIVAAGGHTNLLRLAASDDALLWYAAAAGLKSLSCDVASIGALRAAEPFPALVSLLRKLLGAGSGGSASSSGGSGGNGGSGSGAEDAVEHAARYAADAVHILCMDDPTTPLNTSAAAIAAAKAAVAAGAAATLVQLLPHCSPNTTLLLAVVSAIAALARSGGPGVCGALHAAGGTAALMEQACRHSSSTAVRGIILALFTLLAGSTERSAALAAMPGALPRLAQLLGGAAGREAQEVAATLLVEMMAGGGHRMYSMCTAEGQQLAAAAVSAGMVPAVAAALATALSSCDADTSSPLPVMASTIALSLASGGQPGPLLAAGVVPHLQHLAASSTPAISSVASAALLHLTPPAGSQRTAAAAAAAESAAAPAAAAQPASGQRRRRTCDGPGCTVTSGLRLCGGCSSVRYCSEACSRAHWREHRAECRRLQAERAAAAGAGEG